MRWQGRRQSGNVDDRRGRGRKAAPIGIVGALVGAGIIWALGGDPMAFLSQQAQQQTRAPTRQAPPANDEMKRFVSTILADTEDVWTQLFRARGATYRKPTLVLFTGQVQSACGMQSAAVGPFYCPGDYKAYIDLSFYDELRRKFGAPGDFAQAYVLAHEIGHHVQKLTGVSDKVNRKRRSVSKTQANQLSVRQELQADCYAGVWGHHANKRGLLERGDLEEGLRAAAAIGDDTLQKKARGYAVPESFTHGTSAQRVKWFKKGFASGEPASCDAF